MPGKKSRRSTKKNRGGSRNSTEKKNSASRKIGRTIGNYVRQKRKEKEIEETNRRSRLVVRNTELTRQAELIKKSGIPDLKKFNVDGMNFLKAKNSNDIYDLKTGKLIGLYDEIYSDITDLKTGKYINRKNGNYVD